MPKKLNLSIQGLRRLADGRWILRYYDGATKSGSQRQKTWPATASEELVKLEAQQLLFRRLNPTLDRAALEERERLAKRLSELALAGADAEVIREAAQIGKASLTVAVVAKRYLDACSGEMHASSAKRHRDIFTAHLEPFFGKRPVANLTKSELGRYRRHREAQKVAASTVQRELSVLMAALNYLEEAEPDFRNPLRGGRQRRTNVQSPLEASDAAIGRDRTREPFSPEEWRKFMATFEDERVMLAWLEAQRGKVREFESADRVTVRRGPGTILPTGEAAKALIARRQSLGLLFRAYLYTGGSRLGELLTLRWSDVSLEDGYLRIWQHKVDRHKVVPITAELDAVLRACLRGTGDACVFRFSDGSPIDEKRQVQRAFELGITIAGLAKDASGAPRRLSPHSIRHTVKAWLRAAGYSNEKISGLTGHAEGSSSQAIAKYGGEIDVDALRPMAEDLARIGREGFHDGEAKRYRRDLFTA